MTPPIEMVARRAAGLPSRLGYQYGGAVNSLREGREGEFFPYRKTQTQLKAERE